MGVLAWIRRIGSEKNRPVHPTEDNRAVQGCVGCEIPEYLPLSEIIRAFDTTRAVFYTVVNAAGRTTGIIWAADVNQIRHEEFPAGLIVANDITAPLVARRLQGAREPIADGLQVGGDLAARDRRTEPLARERIMDWFALCLAATFIAAYYNHIL